MGIMKKYTLSITTHQTLNIMSDDRLSMGTSDIKDEYKFAILDISCWKWSHIYPICVDMFWWRKISVLYISGGIPKQICFWSVADVCAKCTYVLDSQISSANSKSNMTSWLGVFYLILVHTEKECFCFFYPDGNIAEKYVLISLRFARLRHEHSQYMYIQTTYVIWTILSYLPHVCVPITYEYVCRVNTIGDKQRNRPFHCHFSG